MPVVFMRHGTGGDGERFLKISGWREKAEQAGLFVVFPTGLVYLVFGGCQKASKPISEAGCAPEKDNIPPSPP